MNLVEEPYVNVVTGVVTAMTCGIMGGTGMIIWREGYQIQGVALGLLSAATFIAYILYDKKKYGT